MWQLGEKEAPPTLLSVWTRPTDKLRQSARQNRQVTLADVFTCSRSLELIYHVHVAQLATLPRWHDSLLSCLELSAAFIIFIDWRVAKILNSVLAFSHLAEGLQLSSSDWVFFFFSLEFLFVDCNGPLYSIFLATDCSKLIRNLKWTLIAKHSGK